MDEQQAVTSIPPHELSLEQLVQLSQGLGHQLDKIRERRAYLKAKIVERLAAGERTATDRTVNPQEESQTIGAADVASSDAAAPGAVVEASASN